MATPAALTSAWLLAGRSPARVPFTALHQAQRPSTGLLNTQRRANRAFTSPAGQHYSARRHLQVVAARTESADLPLGDTVPNFELAHEVKTQGIETIAISSNSVITHPQDGPGKMAEDAQSLGYPFKYLYDDSQAVAKAYKAACTPEFFLADANLQLFYHGQFDGSRPSNDVPVSGEDVKAAIDGMMKQKPLQQPMRLSLGCGITWHPSKQPA